MDIVAYLAEFAAITWPLPHHIPAIKEDDEERLLPLEGLLMNLPDLQGYDLGLLPLQVQDPIQRLPPQLVFTSLPSTWPVYDNSFYVGVEEENQDGPVYENMNYLGVEEENQELLDAQQNMEEEEEPEEEVEEEILITNAVSRQGPVDVSHSTKHRKPMDNDKQLMRDISSSSAEPHISTIGMQELPMPEATPPVFVATLERARLQHPARQ